MTDKELLQQALDALEMAIGAVRYEKTIEILRIRLAQPEPEPEPVLWIKAKGEEQ